MPVFIFFLAVKMAFHIAMDAVHQAVAVAWIVKADNLPMGFEACLIVIAVRQTFKVTRQAFLCQKLINVDTISGAFSGHDYIGSNSRRSWRAGSSHLRSL